MRHEPGVVTRSTPIRLLLIVVVSTLAVDMGLDWALRMLRIPEGWVEALIDAVVLSGLLLPILFLAVFRPLAQNLQNLVQAQVELHAAHDQLEQKNREIGLFAEMSDCLQACTSLEEAHQVTARIGERLFPGTIGAMFVYSASRNDLEMRAAWGSDAIEPGDRVFAPEACWALRHGRVYRLETLGVGLPCRHAHGSLQGESLCVPMIGQGEVLGLLYLRTGRPAPGSEVLPSALNERLAVALSEHVTLALTNLKLRETLRNQAIRDPLTCLFNRRYMEETLERELRRFERTGSSLGVVMLDLDHFKDFNDTYGHEAGDLVLREVGTLLGTHVRGCDVACRYGGEEFALIMPEAGLESVRQRVEALRLDMKQLSVRHGGRLLRTLTVSAGIAMFPGDGTVGEALLRVADGALYRAKADGRDRVVVAGEAPVLA